MKNLKKCFLSFGLILFSHSSAVEREQPIVVIVPSYNNKDWYQKNLDSVFNQNYSNYRVIYIDDLSSDGTGQLVQHYLDSKGLNGLCTLVQNKVRYGPLFNRYKAVHSCQDHEIVVLLDGDDWFMHNEVLSYINRVYSEENILLTVGNACKSTSGKKIGYRDYTEEELDLYGFRQLGFRGVHPRTFYAGLFKKIKTKDLMYGGKFLMMATDVAFMLPMFEMARDRYKYIEDILYVYNDENPINLYKLKFGRQIYFDLITRNRKSYRKLHSSISFEPLEERERVVSHIVFVEEQDDQLYNFYEKKQAEGLSFDSIVRIGRGDPYKFRSIGSYAQQFLTLDIGYGLDQVYHYRFNFKEKLEETLNQCDGEYVLISTEKIAENNQINMRECIKKMEETKLPFVLLGKVDEKGLTGKSYDIAPWGSSYHIDLVGKWFYQLAFKEISDCYGLLCKRCHLMKIIERATMFHPNFSTFMSAFYSVTLSNTLLLVAHSQETQISDASESLFQYALHGVTSDV